MAQDRSKESGDRIEDQSRPAVQVVGKISGENNANDGGSAKYLLHCGWTRKTYQVSTRGLKVLRNLDIAIVDDPSEYTV